MLDWYGLIYLDAPFVVSVIELVLRIHNIKRKFRMNKIKKQIQKALFFTLCLIFSGLAIAEGVYLGADIGQTDYEGEDATSFRLFAGMPVNESFSIEGAWINQGEASESGFDPFFGQYKAELEASGIQISGLGSIPLQDKLSLYGKVGLYLWDVDLSFTDNTGTFSGSDDGSDIFFGFGLNFIINDQLVLRGSYDLISIDIGGESFDADLVSVGLALKVN